MPIIGLPATAKGGATSQIVPVQQPGAGVVTSAGDVHYIITEHGVAYLHGKSLCRRAEALDRRGGAPLPRRADGLVRLIQLAAFDNQISGWLQGFT
jgi:hypothetical protein